MLSQLICLLGLVPLSAIDASTTMNFDWMHSPPGSPGHMCSSQSGWKPQPQSAGGICRSFGRFNMLVVPPGDVTAPMMGGIQFSLDGGAYVDGGSLIYERHMLQSDGDTSISNLPNGTQSQMWAWGYDAIHDNAEQLPHSICVKVWFHDASTGQELLPAPPVQCANFTITHEANYTLGAIKSVMPKSGSDVSVICGQASPIQGRPCRLNAHMTIFTTTGASALDTMVGWSEWAIDGGEFAAGGRTYYMQEAQAREQGEQWPQWQAMQADLDLWVSADSLPKLICLRATVQNTVTMQEATVNTSQIGSGGCLKVCNSLANFHKPYCPGLVTDLLAPVSSSYVQMV